MLTPAEPLPEVGDRYPTWFSGREDGLSVVLATRPYTGKYPEWYTHVLRLTAPRTRRGWMEQSINAYLPDSPNRSLSK